MNCSKLTLVVLGIVLLLAAWISSPRYSLVATTTFNVGGVYKIDNWSGKVWLCEPTAILIDNKTVIAPKGCHEIKDTVGDGAPGTDV